MNAILEYLKSASKQLIAAAVVALIVFFVWPGATLLFFIGMAVGILAGNFWQPLEHMAESLIARARK